jgi:hypothetical protein
VKKPPYKRLLDSNAAPNPYPRTIISKRIEDGESVNVTELFDGLCRRMEDLLGKGWL